GKHWLRTVSTQLDSSSEGARNCAATSRLSLSVRVAAKHTNRFAFAKAAQGSRWPSRRQSCKCICASPLRAERRRRVQPGVVNCAISEGDTPMHASTLVDALKRLLNAHDVTYARVAAGLGLSEARVKRRVSW